MKIIHVVGARPNFMKVAPLMAAMQRQNGVFRQTLVHTGQHYDYQMSQVFFEDLDMPEPDVYLGVGSGSHAEQTGRVMQTFEPVLRQCRPDWVVVVGDVNSTLACALTCAKEGVRVAHVEAGLRSRDRTMPEEINRLLTDQIADLLFTPSRDADDNLLREGVDAEKIKFVGNVMIDSLVRMLPQALRRRVLQELGLDRGQYLLVTLHRPANVDRAEVLREIVAALEELAQDKPVVFPIHPRTRERIEQLGLRPAGVRFLEPMGYIDFLALTEAAGLVLTDSGGIQEETTYLDVPCLTVRPTTERPITLTQGTNRLVSSQRQAILEAVRESQLSRRRGQRRPELWDGRAAERIAQIMLDL